MNSETKLLKALQRFESPIVINAVGNGLNIFKNVIAQNIKISYYIAEISTSTTYSGIPKIVFDVVYKNTDVLENDIYVVSTEKDVQNILCRYVENYKTHLVFFAEHDVDIESAYEKFSVVNAAFYPNYTGMQMRSGKLSSAPMSYYDFWLDYRIGKVKLAMMEKTSTEYLQE